MLLARHILRDCARSAGRRVDDFTPKAVDVIRGYAWPGNVRELRNAIEHAVLLGEGPRIDAGDLPVGIRTKELRARQDDANIVRLPTDLATVERRAIEAALRDTEGNRTKAAALLGINRQTLYNKLAALAEPDGTEK